MRRVAQLFVALTATIAAASDAHADPIVYSGSLFDGIPVVGTINQGNSNSDNPIGAAYFSFHATAGANVTVYGDRLDGDYDMAFWIFRGLYNDTDEFGTSFDTAHSGFVESGDDEDSPNLPGPFGDPRAVFVAPVTGFYTVAVTNYLSGSTPPFDFQLQANGITAAATVPEPGTMLTWGALMGAGLVFSAWQRRKVAPSA